MRIHIVRSGDTMWKLAKKYHVPLQTLIDANPHIANPDKLDVGMKVRIPTGHVPVKPPKDDRDSSWSSESPWSHEVPGLPAPPKYPGSPHDYWSTVPGSPGMPVMPYPPMYGGMHYGYEYAPMPPMMPMTPNYTDPYVPPWMGSGWPGHYGYHHDGHRHYGHHHHGRHHYGHHHHGHHHGHHHHGHHHYGHRHHGHGCCGYHGPADPYYMPRNTSYETAVDTAGTDEESSSSS